MTEVNSLRSASWENGQAEIWTQVWLVPELSQKQKQKTKADEGETVAL